MAALREFLCTIVLTWIAIGFSAAAAAVLFTFPADPAIWEAATWTLVASLCGLFVLVLLLGYALARDPAARTGQRIGTFLIGLGCLSPFALGLL